MQFVLINILKPYLLQISIFYVIIALFTTIYNAVVNKKFSIISWIPLFNIYYLGNLVINTIVGWIYVFILLLIIIFKSFIFLNQYITGFDNIVNVLIICYLIIISCTILYGIYKIIKKKD